MKSIFRNLLARFLGFLANRVIRKYRPKVIMVTGSVGKTSTKDAVTAALTPSFYLRASEKSYNSEFGVPLTIFGVKNPWKNVWGWVRTLEEALALLVFPNHYPKLLVLEVGADRPGDLACILKIATPDAVVVTALPDVPVHVEAYASPHAVREEEFTPATALSPDAPLILCADDPHAISLSTKVRAQHTTFGFSKEADVRIVHEALYVEDGVPRGMRADLMVEGAPHAIVVRGAVGRPQLYAPAAAFALARALGISAEDTLAGLREYVPPPGRSRLIPGIRESVLIDDSYNASPTAVREALDSLCLVAGQHRRVAILGDMLELGRYSAEEHGHIGTTAASCVDVLVTVGIRARAIADAARKEGMTDERVKMFENANVAAAALPNLVEHGDVILIKGSQSIRTERITKALLQDPDDAAQLVRQEEEWQLIK